MRLLLLAAVICVLSLGACAQLEQRAAVDIPAPPPHQTDASVLPEVDRLNRLTRIAIDATRLYEQAAEMSGEPELKSELLTIAEGRKAFAWKLQQRVASLGAKPAETGQISGAIYRSFTALRGLIEDDAVTAAEEVQRGESYIAGELDKTLSEGLSPASRQVVEAELARVKAQRDRIEQVRAEIEQRTRKTAREDVARPDPS
jgi:uncharacterized protein (TIGR02284 family)